MHVLFDARTITTENSRTGSYAISLFESLIPLLSAEDRISFLESSGNTCQRENLPQNVSIFHLKHDAMSWRGHLELRLKVRSLKPDFYWSVDPLIRAYGIRVPHIYSINNLYPHTFPKLVSWRNKLRWRLYGKTQLEQSRRIVCCTNQLKKICLQYLSWKTRNKICVIYNGVHEAFRQHSPKEVADLRIKYRLPEKFLLFVGQDFRYKNLDTLLDVLCENDETASMPLIIAGYNSDTPARRSRIRDLKLNGMVRFIGELPREELSTLYSAAWLVLHPSISESFSQTIVQALACGTPVLCSAVPENEEVFGTAVICVHPTDIIEWRKSLLTMTISTRIRDKLIRGGLECAAKYTWQSAAAETWKCLKEMMRK